jgi:integrase
MVERLTQKRVDRAQPQEARYYIADAVVSGLRLIVYPTGPKRWAVRYKVGRGTGVERLGTIGDPHAMDLETARARAAEVIAAGKQGRDILEEQQPVNELTLQGLWDEFMAEVGQHWSEGTRRLHAGVEGATKDNGKFRGVAAIQRSWIVKIHTENKHRVTMANKVVILLRQLYKWARDTRRLRPDADNPCDPAVAIRLHAVEESPGKEYTDEELGRIGAVLLRGKLRDRLFVLLMAFTGMRPNELLTLRLDQLDLTMRVIRLGRKRNKKATATKTVYQPLVEYLTTLPSNTPLLFPSETDPKVPLNGSVIRRTWSQMTKEAGVEGRLYDLRHTFVTRGVENSLFGTQALVGHSRVDTTQGYVHPRVAALRQLAEQTAGSVAQAMLGTNNTQEVM